MNRQAVARSVREPRGTLLPVSKPILQRKCACGQHAAGGECEECEKKNREIQRKRGIGFESAAIPPVVHEVLRSPGRPLDAEARSFMEPRFGHDFSRVRIHSDAAAARSARAVNALAYTVGHHVVFGNGQYARGSREGRELLAHELTHVLQQGNAPNPGADGLRIGATGDRSEREADTLARAVAQNDGAGSSVTEEPLQVQRQPDRFSGGLRNPWLSGPADFMEAREYARCIETMGEEAQGYCERSTRCPESHTIPDDVYKAIGIAWSKSGHGKAKVAEHGGRVVTNKAGKRVIRTGSGGSGSMPYPAEQPGDVTSATYHSHPYSKSEGSDLGVSFSGADISGFVAGNWGPVQYVGAGSCYFVLDTFNPTKRDACKKEDLKKRWNDSFAKASGSFQAKVETAVKDTIAGCGLCYYKTCRPDNKSPVPKTASLA